MQAAASRSAAPCRTRRRPASPRTPPRCPRRGTLPPPTPVGTNPVSNELLPVGGKDIVLVRRYAVDDDDSSRRCLCQEAVFQEIHQVDVAPARQPDGTGRGVLTEDVEDSAWRNMGNFNRNRSTCRYRASMSRFHLDSTLERSRYGGSSLGHIANGRAYERTPGLPARRPGVARGSNGSGKL